jgi:hypothetical protein
MLAGNLASIGVGGIIAVVTSYIVRHIRVKDSDTSRSDIVGYSGQKIMTGKAQERSMCKCTVITLKPRRRPMKT